MPKGRTTATINSLLRLAARSLRLNEEQVQDGDHDKLSFLVFEIDNEPLAISVEQTEGVVDAPRITPLPHSPSGIIGVASVRGRMTLVTHLRAEEAQLKHKQRLILLKGDSQLGLLADRIDDVITLSTKDVLRTENLKKERPTEGDALAFSKFFFKRKDRLIPIIDAEQIGES
ncbi:MAG: chemotaxis protein CheW [Acidobacteriota bacterium]